MKKPRTKQILEAAAKLPPAKARALLGAVMAAEAGPAADVPGKDFQEWIGAVAGNAEEDLKRVKAALSDDLKDLGEALNKAYLAEDVSTMIAQLRNISEGLPDLEGDAKNTAKALGLTLAKAWAGE